MGRRDDDVLMATPEERHTQVMIRLENLDTKIEERIIPAVEQAWENKDDIIRIKGKIKLGQWVGGVIGSAFIFTIARNVYAYVTKHPH